MGTCRLGSPLRGSTPLPSSLTSGYSPNSETLALLKQAVLLNPPPDLCRRPPPPPPSPVSPVAQDVPLMEGPDSLCPLLG